MQSVNDRYGLADPNDPNRWRLSVQPKKDAPESHKTMQGRLIGSVEKMALAGVVKCRQDIEAVLIRAGWAISRRTKRFISVIHPQIKMPIRLAGRMFHVDWTGAMSKNAIARLAKEFAAARAVRMQETATTLVQLIDARAAYNCERFGGEPVHDPLLRKLIAVRDAPPKPSPKDVLVALRETVQAQQNKIGHSAISLKTITAQMRDYITQAEPVQVEHAKPAAPSTRGPKQ